MTERILEIICCVMVVVVILMTPTQADWYVEAGVGVTNQSMMPKKPDLEPPLAKVAAGYDFGNSMILEFEHLSSMPDHEDNPGMNMIWLIKRWD